jgi:hypothetical protein
MILYMKADEYGNIDYESTKLLVFEGHSVSRLRDELAFLLEEWHAVRITMCVWAGSHGRLTPLVVDLLNNQTVEIVVYESWSRGEDTVCHCSYACSHSISLVLNFL